MKRIAIILLCSLVLYGCNFEEERARLKAEKCELRKFNIGKSDSGSSGWYFLVAGGYTGSTSEATVRFYYKNRNGEFAFMESKLNMVNIKIVDTKRPYVIFDDAYPNEFTRVVIHCREQDFQPEININQLK